MEGLLAGTSRLGFSAYQLKMAAIMAMAADHMGLVFFPAFLPLRIIGRITIPIMAFFISEGYTRTRNVHKYMLRLLIFAIISMPPYFLLIGRSPFNILFDLLLGLVLIDLSRKIKNEMFIWIMVATAACLALLLKTDGMLGVSTLVYLFYRFRDNRRSITFAMVGLFVGIPLILALYNIFTGQPISQFTTFIYPLSVFALPLIMGYNGERGRSLKYFFYAFYPAHLLLIYGIVLLL